jgi:PAS domain-containing protein
MGKAIAAALGSDGHDVIWFHDRFPDPETTDVAWLAEAGKNHWIVLTEDVHVRRRSNELQTLAAANVRCFIFGSASRSTSDRLKLVQASDWPGRHNPPRNLVTPARLRESELQCQRIAETAQEGIWQIDAEDRTMFVNQKLADLLATAAKVAEGR